MLHTETVSPYLLNCLNKLMQRKELSEFRLVGGTALSLMLGHRISVDIDLFTDVDYGSLNLSSIANALRELFPYVDGLDKLTERNLGYTLYCGENEAELIKLDLYYTDKFLYPAKNEVNVRMADIKDIAAMKILALDNSNRKKDYWDLHELLCIMDLGEILNIAQRRYPYVIDVDMILKKLVNIPVGEIDNVPIKCLKGKYWEFVVEDIQEVALAELNKRGCGSEGICVI